MSALLPEAREVDAVRQPLTRWRNWWRMTGDGWALDVASGRELLLNDGDIVEGDDLFPSRDVAESAALKLIDEEIARGVEPMDYVGAFPEGERP